MGQAQLITPDGRAIALPEKIYFKVMEMLEIEKPTRKWTPEEIEAIIKRTRGAWKVEGKRPLTEALLESRREELEREEKRIREHHRRVTTRRKRAT